MKEVLLNVLYIVIITCSITVVGEILKFVNSKIDDIQEKIKLQKYTTLNKYIDNAQEVITDAVKTINQIYVDDLKKAGNFTEEAKIEAKSQCIDLIKKTLSAETKNAMHVVFGDFIEYLSLKIESVIASMK